MLLYKNFYFALKSIFAFSLIILTLSACSFSPLYSDKGLNKAKLNLSYAEPNSRLEQIIYNDLRKTLGQNENSNLLTISASSHSRSVARSSNGTPSSINEVIISANIKVSDFNNPSNIIFSETRTAASSYSTNDQIIADKKAYENAQEVAALELAKIIRLTLIGALSNSDISN